MAVIGACIQHHPFAFQEPAISAVSDGGFAYKCRAATIFTATRPGWSRTAPGPSGNVPSYAADPLEARTRDIVELPARETRCIRVQDVPGPVRNGPARQAAGIPYAPRGQVIPFDVPGRLALGIPKPVGVVGSIAPWNAALIRSARPARDVERGLTSVEERPEGVDLGAVEVELAGDLTAPLRCSSTCSSRSSSGLGPCDPDVRVEEDERKVHAPHLFRPIGSTIPLRVCGGPVPQRWLDLSQVSAFSMMAT